MNYEEKTPADYLIEKEDSFFIDLALCTITQREKQALEMRFFEQMTFGEMGKALNVTGERARQIMHKGLRKMRHPCRMFIYADCCLKY